MLYRTEITPKFHGLKIDLAKQTPSHKKYNMSYELLSVYQAGAVAFQTMLNIESYKDADIHHLSKFLLRQALHIAPVKKYDINAHREYIPSFEKAIYHISYPTIVNTQEPLWQKIFKHISQTSLAPVWSLFIPFLEKPFSKGLCPIAFYAYTTFSSDPTLVIYLAQLLMDNHVQYRDDMPMPLTYVILDVQGKKMVDSLSEIIKSCCEK